MDYRLILNIFAAGKHHDMLKKIKNFLFMLLWATVSISFSVMVFALGLQTPTSLRVGFISGWIFGVSFLIFLVVVIPDDEDKGLIDHGRYDG